MSYYLFLDDSRKPHQVTWATLPENAAWVQARSYTDFVYVLGQMGIPKFVAYDCDLCQEHYDCYFSHREKYLLVYQDFKTKCGIHCVEHLIKLCKKNGVKHPDYIVHTQNNYVQGFMEKTIEDYNKSVVPTANVLDDLAVPDVAWNKIQAIPDYAKHDDKVISGFFGPYRFLSNFWPASVEWRGHTFPSVEIAYQAAKCADPKQMIEFTALTPSEAKKKGQHIIIRPAWDAERLKVMEHLVTKKFSDDESLRKMLLSTGSKELVEANAWKDKFWGVYYRFNGTNRQWECFGGDNNLGKILMQVRQLVA